MSITDLQKKNELRQELRILEMAIELIDGLANNEYTELQNFQRNELGKRVVDIKKALED